MTSPNQLSFLPDDYLEQKRRRRANMICGLLMCVVMAALVPAVVLSLRSNHDIEAREARINQEYAEQARRIEMAREIKTRQSRMAHQAELAASLLEKLPRSYLLAELTNALPENVSLLDFSLDSKVRQQPVAEQPTAFDKKKKAVEAENGKKAPEPVIRPKVYDVTVKLTGIAYNDVQVAQYMNKLRKSANLQDINLIVVEEFSQQDEKLRKFQLEMQLNPDAEIHLDPKASAEKTAHVELEAVDGR